MTNCANYYVGLYLAGSGVGQNRADVAFKQLLNQIEGIHDLADLRDTAVAKRVKRRDVELHDAVVAALAEEHANNRRDRGARDGAAGAARCSVGRAKPPGRANA